MQVPQVHGRCTARLTWASLYVWGRSPWESPLERSREEPPTASAISDNDYDESCFHRSIYWAFFLGGILCNTVVMNKTTG